jgi:hypothetical protein
MRGAAFFLRAKADAVADFHKPLRLLEI